MLNWMIHCKKMILSKWQSQSLWRTNLLCSAVKLSFHSFYYSKCTSSGWSLQSSKTSTRILTSYWRTIINMFSVACCAWLKPCLRIKFQLLWIHSKKLMTSSWLDNSRSMVINHSASSVFSRVPYLVGNKHKIWREDFFIFSLCLRWSRAQHSSPKFANKTLFNCWPTYSKDANNYLLIHHNRTLKQPMN